MGANGGQRRGGPADIAVRTGAESDATGAASLHADQIAEGFLSFLGPRFLTRLYRRIILSPDAFVLVADDAGRVVGFIAGAGDIGRLYRSFLWHDGVRAGVDAAGRLLRGWRRAIETLRHGSGQGTGRGVELLAIAVDPANEGNGVGTRLVTQFLSEVGRRGGDSAFVVVAAANQRAIALYERSGFRTEDTFELHAGTTSLLLQWDRPAPGPVDGGRP
jgi:ribosomal protein S18 acetylase RimI-like enzyme